MLEEVSLTRTVRLSRLQHLLYRNPRGLTTAELARECGISRRTAERDLRALQDMGVPVWENANRYGIDSGYFLPPVHLSLPEAGALYLAARLLSRHNDEHNPHVVDALAKLAGVLPDSIARHVQRTVVEALQRQENALLTGVFETLILGWATGRKVRIWYRSVRHESLHEYVFAPYAIEPIGGGNSTYVIGWADQAGEVRTFKMERIDQAELLDDRFETPDDFDLPSQLQSSWGIIWGEEAVEVRLRFTPQVTRRVKETIWQQSQTLEDQSDGGCLLTVQVSGTLEMSPWLRSWGPNCEVLAPESLRQQMAEWARETAQLYYEGK